MNTITKWNYESSEIRTILQDGEPWFVLADVCKVLELSNPRSTAERLDEDERRKFDLPRQGETWCINESGLYTVILRSDKPQAKPFRKWVTGEVLPTIRKAGAYVQTTMSQLEMISMVAKGAVELERRQKVLETQLHSVSDKLNQALDVFTESAAETDWKSCINRKINAVCKQNRLNYMLVRRDMYAELEQIARCNLTRRVSEKQKRLRAAGEKYRDAMAVTKVDVIADDARLRPIFDGIVKRLEARYIQGANVQLGMELQETPA